MDYLKTFVAVLVLLSCGEAEISEPFMDEEVRQGIQIPSIEVAISHPAVVKSQSGAVGFEGKPFSGYLISRYSNDANFLKQGYLDGTLNGMTTGFYPNGQVLYSRPYLNGEKHGEHVGYHENGKREFRYYFVNGFSEGNHKKWYADGSLLSDMNYQNGKERGKQQVWRPDGKLRANYVVHENGRRYGLQGIKRCTKLDGVSKTIDPYKGEEQ